MALDREAIGGWVTKLQGIADRFAEVEKRVSDPDVAADQEQFTAFMVEHRRLKPMAEKAKKLVEVLSNWDEASEWASSDDPDMKALGVSELPGLTAFLEKGVEEAKWMLLPQNISPWHQIFKLANREKDGFAYPRIRPYTYCTP